MKAMLKIGHAVVVDDGAGLWDHVHIEDLADLYRLVVLDVVEREGKALPSGKKAIMFSGNGRHSWLEYSQLVADACYEKALISERKVTISTGAAVSRLRAFGLSDICLATLLPNSPNSISWYQSYGGRLC